jgi:SAM-dependent methyltransferase
VWLAGPRIDAAVEVEINGQVVWAFNPRRDAEARAGHWFVAWPAPLRPYLVGTGHVVARDHLSGQIVLEEDVQLGDKAQPIAVRDRQGHRLAMVKSGHLTRVFAERDQTQIDALLDAAERTLRFLREEGGVPAFLAFGGLLGAVRSGRLIGHDNDLDVSYLSRYSYPADVIRESFQLERRFREAGWQTWRFSANDFKVLAERVGGAARWIDIFGAWITDRTLYVMPNVAAPAREVRIEPLGEVTLEGRALPAPADPEALLAATYGPGWRVPDPSFRFDPPRTTLRRMNGWYRSAIANRNHWYGFYESARAKNVPAEPSTFARWFAEREPIGTQVVDVGCGTARDTLWLAGQGYPATGLDYAPPALSNARQAARRRGVDATFTMLNLYDTRQVLTTGAQWGFVDGPVALYARFLVHALNDRGRDGLWRLASMALRRRGRLYLEFRTGDDRNARRFEFGRHFRKYVSPAQVAAEIARYGGHVEFQHEGYGLAVYKNEDPLVCRMVISWQS